MANNRVADSLLKWGLRNSEANPDAPGNLAAVSADIASGKRPDLADPGLYNAIMGKSEAQMMQEELAAALDTSRTEQDRCTALDNFEMVRFSLDHQGINSCPLTMILPPFVRSSSWLNRWTTPTTSRR